MVPTSSPVFASVRLPLHYVSEQTTQEDENHVYEHPCRAVDSCAERPSEVLDGQDIQRGDEEGLELRRRKHISACGCHDWCEEGAGE